LSDLSNAKNQKGDKVSNRQTFQQFVRDHWHDDWKTIRQGLQRIEGDNKSTKRIRQAVERVEKLERQSQCLGWALTRLGVVALLIIFILEFIL
jgi:hypothetical protein